jgi:phosphatidate cytidylyltransferase
MATLHRTLSGAIFGVLFCLGLFVNKAQVLVPIIISLGAIVGTLEFFSLAKGKGFKGQAAFACVIACALVADGYFWGLRHLGIILAAGMLLSFGLALRRGGIEQILARSSITFLGCFYVGLPLAMAVAILHGPGTIQGSRFLLVFIILTVWSSDIGAYFIGRRFGKKKLAPKLSPGKSVEGMFGGFAATFIAAILLKLAWPQVASVVTWAEALILAAVFCVAGLIGDLMESAMKRDAGIKDSGINITGHGGMLDIIDSILFCLPVFYIHWVFFYPKLHPELF